MAAKSLIARSSSGVNSRRLIAMPNSIYWPRLAGHTPTGSFGSWLWFYAGCSGLPSLILNGLCEPIARRAVGRWLDLPFASRPGKDKLGLSFEIMIPKVKSASIPAFCFPEWAARLRRDDSLTPGLPESYRQTLARFLEFCQQRQAGTSVSAARARSKVCAAPSWATPTCAGPLAKRR